MTAQHVVFVDSTLAGLLAFKAAKNLGCTVTFIHPQDSSFLTLTTTDRSKIDPHLSNVDLHLTLPTLSDGGLSHALQRLQADSPIDALITTSEAAILHVAKAADELGIRSAGFAALKRSVFKNDCRSALENAGVRSPAFEVLSEADLLNKGASRISLPFVVKPTRGFGKQFSAVCKQEGDFEAFTRALSAVREDSDPMINIIVNNEYIVEQYIDGSLHSAEVVVRDGQIECFATTTRYRSRHNELLEMGYSMPSGLSSTRQAQLTTYLQEVFDAVGLQFGLYHVEILFAEDGPYLVEINGRMMGGVGPQIYQTLSGHDAFELLIRLHLGQSVEIDQKAIQQAGTVILIGARDAGVVSGEFTQEKLDGLLRRYGITFCTLSLQAHQPVRKFEGNVSILGHVIVEGQDQTSSARKGHDFLLELDELLGVEVAKYRH